MSTWLGGQESPFWWGQHWNSLRAEEKPALGRGVWGEQLRKWEPICAECQFGTFWSHSRSKETKPVMVEVLAEEEKQVIAAKGIFSDREVGVLGFDAYSWTPGKTQNTQFMQCFIFWVLFLDSSHIKNSFTSPNNPKIKYYVYHPLFTGEQTGTDRASDLPTVTQQL